MWAALCGLWAGPQLSGRLAEAGQALGAIRDAGQALAPSLDKLRPRYGLSERRALSESPQDKGRGGSGPSAWLKMSLANLEISCHFRGL
jgi:hypothetical protein